MRSLLLSTTAVFLPVLALGCHDEVTQPPDPAANMGVAIPTNTIPATAFGRVSGGGQMNEGHWKISFAGQAGGEGDLAPTPWSQQRWMSLSPTGQWVIQFHNVSEPRVSGATFKSTRVMDFWFSLPETLDTDCVGSMAITVEGRLNGEPGWVLWFRASDVGKNKRMGQSTDVLDTVRAVIWAPGDHPDGALIAYDSDADDFPRETTCSGPKRTGLDSGNIKISVSY